MFAILGSGFGLYGYLPALVEGCSQSIALPERYRVTYTKRNELARFANSIQWKNNEDAALDCATGVVLALPPIYQSEWIPHCLTRSNIQQLLLEKPLAYSPELSEIIFNDLMRSKKYFRIGYTFRYTSWGKQLLNLPPGLSSLTINWNFLAHHYRHDLNNWKRYHSTGGGVVRFYGIQIIALLAEIGYQDVVSSQTFGKEAEDLEQWVAVFTGPHLPECHVTIDTKSSETKFSIKEIHTHLNDPFDAKNDPGASDTNDRRVPMLIDLCQSLKDQEQNPYNWYERTNNLWHIVEKKTKLEIIH